MPQPDAAAPRLYQSSSAVSVGTTGTGTEQQSFYTLNETTPQSQSGTGTGLGNKDYNFPAQDINAGRHMPPPPPYGAPGRPDVTNAD